MVKFNLHRARSHIRGDFSLDTACKGFPHNPSRGFPRYRAAWIPATFRVLYRGLLGVKTKLVRRRGDRRLWIPDLDELAGAASRLAGAPYNQVPNPP